MAAQKSATKKDKKPIKTPTLKYVPTWSSTAMFFVLFGIAVVLFQGRKHEWARFEFITEIMPDFFIHISNYTLSYLLYGGIGYLWLLIGIPFRFILFFGVLLIGINLIYELYIPILNTPDIVDAYFGIAGTVVAFLFLTYVKFFGMIKIEDAENK